MATTRVPPKRMYLVGLGWRILDWLVSLVTIFLCVGTPPPGINESHYIPKAKRVWDVSFASGRDIFLDSNDSHFLASCLAGNLAKHYELETVAWIGRLSSWLLLSIAWSRFTRALRWPWIVHCLLLPAWVLAVRYGHWAGEWFVGGYEAKSLAYPFVLLALAMVVEDRWSMVWIFLALAIALHPVVGGWALITVIPVMILQPGQSANLRRRIVPIAVSIAIGTIGVLPALSGLGSTDSEGNFSAARVHVFSRLAHHMCPRFFDVERWMAGGVTLTTFLSLSWVWLKRNGCFSTESKLIDRLRALSVNAEGKLLLVACFAIGVSAAGWIIDIVGYLTHQTTLSAKLLRFYFFRWSDVVVPLAICVLLGRWLTKWCFLYGDTNLQTQCMLGTVQMRFSLAHVSQAGRVTLPSIVVLTFAVGVWHWRHDNSSMISAADRWMLEKPGPFPVRFDESPEDPLLPARYRDWLAVCDWIKKNSPRDSLWFTPKHQQSFKWYAQRAEVVSWKDVPQDNASILEWYRRIQESDDPRVLTCAPRKNSKGEFRGWTTDEFIELAKKYRFNWILVDRTYQDLPPLLELKYPIEIDNRSFAVFYVPSSLIDH